MALGGFQTCRKLTGVSSGVKTPDRKAGLMSELKLRPPKDLTVFATWLAEDVLYLVEETGGALGWLVFDFHRLAELLEYAALLAGDFCGDIHPNDDVKLAAAAVGISQALPFFAENLSGLRAFGNFESFLAMHGGDFDSCAESSLRDADRHRAIQIRAAAFEILVFFYFEENV